MSERSAQTLRLSGVPWKRYSYAARSHEHNPSLETEPVQVRRAIIYAALKQPAARTRSWQTADSWSSQSPAHTQILFGFSLFIIRFHFSSSSGHFSTFKLLKCKKKNVSFLYFLLASADWSLCVTSRTPPSSKTNLWASLSQTLLLCWS